MHDTGKPFVGKADDSEFSLAAWFKDELSSPMTQEYFWEEVFQTLVEERVYPDDRKGVFELMGPGTTELFYEVLAEKVRELLPSASKRTAQDRPTWPPRRTL